VDSRRELVTSIGFLRFDNLSANGGGIPFVVTSICAELGANGGGIPFVVRPVLSLAKHRTMNGYPKRS